LAKLEAKLEYSTFSGGCIKCAILAHDVVLYYELYESFAI